MRDPVTTSTEPRTDRAVGAAPSTRGDLLRGVAWLVAVVGLWFAVARWVLPALGCGT